MRQSGSSERFKDMEYAIAVFVGLWVAVSGLLAYRQISKDFADIGNEEVERKEKTQK